MNKNLITISAFILVAVVLTSFASAGWWTNFIRRAPNAKDEGNAFYSPSNFGLEDLSKGVSLTINWNYWYTWADKEISVEEVTSSLSDYVKMVLEFDSSNSKYNYWYNNKFYPSNKDEFTQFKKGKRYALLMNGTGVWKYSQGTLFDIENCDAFKISSNGKSYYFRAKVEYDSTIGTYLTTIQTRNNGVWVEICIDKKIGAECDYHDFALRIVDARKIVDANNSGEWARLSISAGSSFTTFDNMCIDDKDIPVEISCNGTKATLSDGETTTINGNTISASVIGSNSVKFAVNGVNTGELAEGSSFKVSDKLSIKVLDILYQDFVGGKSEVSFCLSESSLSEEYYTKTEVDAMNSHFPKTYILRATNFKTENNINKTTIQYKKDGVWVDKKQDAKAGDEVFLENLWFYIRAIDYMNRTIELKGTTGNYTTYFDGGKETIIFNRDTDFKYFIASVVRS